MMANSKEVGIGTDSTFSKTLNAGDTLALKDFLEKRLADCGWRKQIDEMVRSKLEECGAANITRDELAKIIIPNARAMVPDEVRDEMVLRMREALQCPLPLPDDNSN